MKSSSCLFGQHRTLSCLTLMFPDEDDGEPSPLPRYRNSGGRFVSIFSFDLNVHRLDDGCSVQSAAPSDQ